MDIPKINLYLNGKCYTIINYVMPTLEVIDKWLLIKDKQEDIALSIKTPEDTKEYVQKFNKSYRDNFALVIDYIKIMIDKTKIKDESLIEAIESETNSEFWSKQDVVMLSEAQSSFRQYIKL